MAKPSRTEQGRGLSSDMGSRLRTRRSDLGLTLTEAARRADVSTSYLAAVENGASTPSLPVLSRITHALQMTIGGFLADDTASAVELGRLGDTPGTHLVSSETLQLRIAVQHAAGGESGPCPLDIAGVTVFAYVRAGEVQISVDGESWRLDEGDSIHANDSTEVVWLAADGGCTLIWATAPTDATVSSM